MGVVVSPKREPDWSSEEGPPMLGSLEWPLQVVSLPLR
jgi:hypothetical protein